MLLPKSMRTSLNSSETEVPSSMALFAFVLLYFVFLNCLSISEVSHYFEFFFYILYILIFRGHGNKSCNLIGSLPSQYFPISAHGPSTSQIPLPFFINIPHFAGWAVFLCKHIGHYLKPTYESSPFSLSNHFG